MRGRAAFVASVTAVLVAAAIACSHTVDTPFVPPVIVEAGSFGGNEAGIDPTIGGPCTVAAQCDDGIACTFDACDQTIGRCRYKPDDTQCQNGTYCDGNERCLPRIGCAAGLPETCSDNNTCTIDRCVESTRSCEHNPRDADGDGDATLQCGGGSDCNDNDPAVSSRAHEVCGNGRDDNCNGQVDEMPCSTSPNDTCASPLAVTASGTYFVSTEAAQSDYPLSCAGALGTGLRDVVLDVLVPEGGPHDVDVWTTATDDVVFALQRTCGSATGEIGCAMTPKGTQNRVLAHSLAPGHYSLVVAARSEVQIDVNVGIRPPTPAPTNEKCSAAQTLTEGVATLVQLSSPVADHETTCTRTGGELAYAFTLAAPRDVRIYSAVTRGTGVVSTSLRQDGTDDASCTEVSCKNNSSVALFAHSLPAGRHRVTVSATAGVDASLLLQTAAPTPPAADESCATAPTVAPNGVVSVDLQNHGNIATGCFTGAPNAAYRLDLAQASDVLIVGRFSVFDAGAISLHGTTCSMGDSLGCAVGATPQRISKRNLPAGTYRIVVAQDSGHPATVTALVRPTLPPTVVTSGDRCDDALQITSAGGFFTGNTSMFAADYTAGCDSAGANAKDQIVKLVLAEEKRVVFDMSGSAYTTILDVRDNTGCPGAEIPGLCYVGFGAQRSFLDTTYNAGTYNVLIDGFGGETGAWNLDVRVLDPL